MKDRCDLWHNNFRTLYYIGSLEIHIGPLEMLTISKYPKETRIVLTAENSFRISSREVEENACKSSCLGLELLRMRATSAVNFLCQVSKTLLAVSGVQSMLCVL